MSKYMLSVATILTAGSLMAGTPSLTTSLGTVTQLSYALVSGERSGDDGGGGHEAESRGREAEARGREAEARGREAEARGRESEAGEDYHGHGEIELGDDKGVDVNDQPDDSTVVLFPLQRADRK